MAKAFSVAFKKKMVERLVGRGAVSACELSRETGVSQEALSRWLRVSRRLPPMASGKRTTRTWSLEQKVQVLATATKLEGGELAVYLKREGITLAEFESWRLGLAEGGTSAAAATRRIRVLERELARKDKALAEAAALLVLKKKVDLMFRDDEDDDTEEDSEK
jgi:DNA-binding transcriptional ArsR family regulator